jgi:cytoskeletal protein CcmA (bactofilin family)
MDNSGFRWPASPDEINDCPTNSVGQRRAQLSYFSQPKGERDMKIVKTGEPRLADAATGRSAPEMVSTLGHGMLITGNIVCAGSLQIFGRVVGDIHASQLVICEGAKVEGKLIAPETIVQGVFHGTIHGNNVKLASTAVVDGEIFNKTLAIEQNAMFEGVSRRLEKAVEVPASPQAKSEKSAAAPSAQVVPISEAHAKV